VQHHRSVFNRKTRFITVISLLLVIGFFGTSLVSYFVANNSLDKYIRTNTLPLTSDNIYSEIQRDVLPTIVISSLMAQDTFVRDWIIDGEKESDLIVRYLKSIQNRYKTATAFFISDKTLNYYHSTGLLKQVNADDINDSWYFKVEQLKDDFEINVDTDTAKLHQTNFFVNHKITDYNGNYLGTIGVGLSSDTVTDMIEFYQNRYDRQVYFMDPTGKITMRGKNYQGADNIRQTQGLSEISTQVLASPGGSYTYSRNDQDIFLKTRFVPELNWFLFVEQVGKPESHIQKTLWVNLSLSFLITLIVLFVANLTISKYQRRLEIMATKDKLTGIDNRHAFDPAFQQVLKTATRNKQALSVVLIDIDHFKKVNDNYGHSVGDKVLIIVAKLLKNNLRESDLLCRWGGEEFMMLLPKCPLADANLLAEKIRLQIENEIMDIDGEHISITASFGVCEYDQNKSQQELFELVDNALYHAKDLGRNRVEIA
jgi:diguanylate cyclase (GGDEF)-like protein